MEAPTDTVYTHHIPTHVEIHDVSPITGMQQTRQDKAENLEN